MPLENGKGKKIIKANIKELAEAFKASGKIGTSHPANIHKALAQAAAIAYSKARKGKK